LAKTSFNIAAAPANVGWQISVDADWFDESGQVESRIEAVANCSGQNNSSSVNGLVFHVTILAAVAAWSVIISKLADLPSAGQLSTCDRPAFNRKHSRSPVERSHASRIVVLLACSRLK